MEESNVLDAGTVWMVTSAAMVLLMTPGLAIFYGGMTRAKSSLNMIMMSFVSMGLVGVVWVLWVHGMTGGDGWAGVVGNPAGDLGHCGAPAFARTPGSAYRLPSSASPMCGRSSVGRASPCQGEGRRFESGRPLHPLPRVLGCDGRLAQR